MHCAEPEGEDRQLYQRPLEREMRIAGHGRLDVEAWEEGDCKGILSWVGEPGVCIPDYIYIH
jgi:hypothetical protein